MTFYQIQIWAGAQWVTVESNNNPVDARYHMRQLCRPGEYYRLQSPNGNIIGRRDRRRKNTRGCQ